MKRPESQSRLVNLLTVLLLVLSSLSVMGPLRNVLQLLAPVLCMVALYFLRGWSVPRITLGLLLGVAGGMLQLAALSGFLSVSLDYLVCGGLPYASTIWGFMAERRFMAFAAIGMATGILLVWSGLAMVLARPLGKRTKRVVWLAPLLVISGYGLALVRHGSSPTGYVASYRIFPHDPDDVLDFRDGLVTARTCCGDEPQGTFRRLADGSWVWTMEMGLEKKVRKATRMEFLMRPHLLSIEFINRTDPSERFTLRRRVFKTLGI